MAWGVGRHVGTELVPEKQTTGAVVRMTFAQPSIPERVQNPPLPELSVVEPDQPEPGNGKCLFVLALPVSTLATTPKRRSRRASEENHRQGQQVCDKHACMHPSIRTIFP